jgi:hypothetical protein
LFESFFFFFCSKCIDDIKWNHFKTGFMYLFFSKSVTCR